MNYENSSSSKANTVRYVRFERRSVPHRRDEIRIVVQQRVLSFARTRESLSIVSTLLGRRAEPHNETCQCLERGFLRDFFSRQRSSPRSWAESFSPRPSNGSTGMLGIRMQIGNLHIFISVSDTSRGGRQLSPDWYDGEDICRNSVPVLTILPRFLHFFSTFLYYIQSKSFIV